MTDTTITQYDLKQTYNARETARDDHADNPSDATHMIFQAACENHTAMWAAWDAQQSDEDE